MKQIEPLPEDRDSFYRIHVDENDDVFSMKRALWANQTLLIEGNKLARERNRLLADIKYWVCWMSFILFLILIAIGWYK